MKMRVGKSKWEKWNCIQQAPHLVATQPQTSIYSVDQLRDYLTMFQFVYVKPDGRSMGKNVIRISRSGHRYTAQKNKEVKRFDTLDQLDQWLSTIHQGERYIVQQGISFAKLQGRLVDLRSIILRNEHGKWEVTGYIAKHAGTGSAVTNYSAGGKLIPIDSYLDGLKYTRAQKEAFYRRFHKLSSEVGEQLGKTYSNYIFGLDIGIDTKGKLWVIEANTKPDNFYLRKYNYKMYKRTKELEKYNTNV